MNSFSGSVKPKSASGSDGSVIEWLRPEAVVEWEWVNETIPALRKTSWLFFKWTLMLCIPVLFLLLGLAPNEAWAIGREPLMIAFVVPFMWAQLWVNRRQQVRYRLDSEGIHYQSRSAMARTEWTKLETIALVDHPDIPGLRGLELHVRRREPARWWFDTAMVDEEELLDLIARYRPTVGVASV